VVDILLLSEDERDSIIAQVDRRGRDLLVAIGTCSIDEPVDALVALGVL
jgi:3-deoxy-D-arabino-heptulosonate 7-phosphate (DAHP) synthase